MYVNVTSSTSNYRWSSREVKRTVGHSSFSSWGRPQAAVRVHAQFTRSPGAEGSAKPTTDSPPYVRDPRNSTFSTVGVNTRQAYKRHQGSIQHIEQRLEQRGKQDAQPSAALDSEALLQQLATAINWTQISQAVQAAQQQGLLDPSFISAALTSLSIAYKGGTMMNLHASDRAAAQRLLDSLLAASSQQLKHHRAQHMAHIIAALARLRTPSENYVELLVDRLLGRLQDLSGEDQAAALWGLAKLGHFPGGHWLSAWLGESGSKLQDMYAVQLSSTLWALAKFKYRPGQEWLQDYWAALAPQLLYLNPRELCNVLWACASLQLQQQLPPQLCASLLLEAQVKLPAYSGRSLPRLAWALCTMDITPGASWLQDFCIFTKKALPTFKKPQCFTNTIWALANWRHSPSQEWLQAFCIASLPRLGRLDSTELPIFICGLAQLGHHPGHSLACYLLECLHRRHKQLTPKNLAACISAMAQLLRPADAPANWRLHRRWVLQYAVILEDLAGACRGSLRQLECGDLCAVVEGFAGLRYFPGDAFMVRHEQLCNARVTEFSVYQITSLKRAYQRLDEIYEQEYGGQQQEQQEEEEREEQQQQKRKKLKGKQKKKRVQQQGLVAMQRR